MFPSRASRTWTALLEIAEAVLAPAPETPHPHAREATLSIARRPAPTTPPTVCLSPLAHRGTGRPATAAERRPRPQRTMR